MMLDLLSIYFYSKTDMVIIEAMQIGVLLLGVMEKLHVLHLYLFSSTTAKQKNNKTESSDFQEINLTQKITNFTISKK